MKKKLDTPLHTRQVFTVEETADYLRVSRSTIYRLMREHTLPFAKVGGRTLVRRYDVDVMLEKAMTR
jgi:excisionase family DNA binding protein